MTSLLGTIVFQSPNIYKVNRLIHLFLQQIQICFSQKKKILFCFLAKASDVLKRVEWEIPISYQAVPFSLTISLCLVSLVAKKYAPTPCSFILGQQCCPFSRPLFSRILQEHYVFKNTIFSPFLCEIWQCFQSKGPERSMGACTKPHF